jgi:hypothetical protein
VDAPFAEIHFAVDSSAPIELPAEIVGLGEPIVPFNPSLNTSAPTEIIIDMTSNLLVHTIYERPTDLCVPFVIFIPLLI